MRGTDEWRKFNPRQFGLPGTEEIIIELTFYEGFIKKNDVTII